MPRRQPSLKGPGSPVTPKPKGPSKEHKIKTSKSKTSVYIPIGVIVGFLLVLGLLFGLKDIFQASPEMQNFTGQNIADVMDELSGKGVNNVQIVKQISYSEANSRVLDCMPEAGTTLADLPVKLTVAYNPQETNKFSAYFTQGVNHFLKEKQIFLYRLLFFDTFNGKRKDWRPLDKNTNNFTVQQIRGHLFVEKKAGKGPLLIDYPGPFIKDFIIRTDIAKVKNALSLENGFYYMDSANMLNLLIDLQHKKYFAGFLKYAKWSGQWKTEKSIAKNYTNFLEMVVYEGNAFFFVNGKMKEALNGLQVIRNGRVGLMVNSANMPVAFDNVVVCGIL